MPLLSRSAGLGGLPMRSRTGAAMDTCPGAGWPAAAGVLRRQAARLANGTDGADTACAQGRAPSRPRCEGETVMEGKQQPDPATGRARRRSRGPRQVETPAAYAARPEGADRRGAGGMTADGRCAAVPPTPSVARQPDAGPGEASVRAAWLRAEACCECEQATHGHPGRCDQFLIWGARGETGAGGWEARRLPNPRPGCVILCAVCSAEVTGRMPETLRQL